MNSSYLSPWREAGLQPALHSILWPIKALPKFIDTNTTTTTDRDVEKEDPTTEEKKQLLPLHSYIQSRRTDIGPQVDGGADHNKNHVKPNPSCYRDRSKEVRQAPSIRARSSSQRQRQHGSQHSMHSTCVVARRHVFQRLPIHRTGRWLKDGQASSSHDRSAERVSLVHPNTITPPDDHV